MGWRLRGENGKPIIAGYPLPHWRLRPGVRTVCAISPLRDMYNVQCTIHCTLHYIVDLRTLASSLIKAELVYLSLPLSLVQIIPGQKLANRNLPPEPNIPVSTTMRQLTFKTKSLFHFGMSVSEMFHSPSTFAFHLFFLSEASFIKACQVLLCLACLLSPARLEHIAASSSHSSTSSFEHCSTFLSTFILFSTAGVY